MHMEVPPRVDSNLYHTVGIVVWREGSACGCEEEWSVAVVGWCAWCRSEGGPASERRLRVPQGVSS